MAFKEVFIDRKSCKPYENGIKSQKYLLFFTFGSPEFGILKPDVRNTKSLTEKPDAVMLNQLRSNVSNCFYCY